MHRVPVTITADGYDIKKKITDVNFTIQAVEDPEIKLVKTSRFYKN